VETSISPTQELCIATTHLAFSAGNQGHNVTYSCAYSLANQQETLAMANHNLLKTVVLLLCHSVYSH